MRYGIISPCIIVQKKRISGKFLEDENKFNRVEVENVLKYCSLPL